MPDARITDVMSTRFRYGSKSVIPEWYKVEVDAQPDGDGNLSFTLDYHDCTFETRISPEMAYRLAESLIQAAEGVGLADGFVRVLDFIKVG